MSVPKPVYISGVWIVRTWAPSKPMKPSASERFGVGAVSDRAADGEAGEAAVWGWG